VRLKTAIAVLLGLSSFCACNKRGRAVVVLNDQRSVKQAQIDCQSRAQDGVPLCQGDPTRMIRDLEAQTSRAFELNTACKGITLVTLNASDDPSQLNSRHTWWLFLELMRTNMPEENELRYTVSHTQDLHRSPSETGQGTPSSMIAEVCRLIQKGGIAEIIE
jgi:hypothetical protein